MADLELDLDDDLADAVRRLAARLRVTPEEFAARAIRVYLEEAHAAPSPTRPPDAAERPICD